MRNRFSGFLLHRAQRFAGKLSGIQYALLELMVESDRIWYWGNVMTIFRSFGLADGRKDLRQMLGNLRAELAATQDKSALADTEDKSPLADTEDK